MSCEEVSNLISAELDGELLPEDRPALEAHLAVCVACRSVLEAFRLQDGELRRSFAPRRRAAQDLARSVVARLRSRGPGGRLGTVVLQLSTAAAGFALALLLFRPWERGPDRTPHSPPIVAVKEAPAGTPKAHSTVSAPIPMATLTLAMGMIEVLPPGEREWKAAPAGGPIDAGTRVRTGPEALCEFRTADGSAVRLNVATEVAFLSERRLDLARGQVLSTVAHAPTRFEVTVPEATVAALGTEFDLQLRGDETQLIVVEGSTLVSGKTGNEIVHRGQRATIGRGAVKKRDEYDIILATSWVHKILARKRESSPEVAKRLEHLLAAIGKAKMEELSEREVLELGESCVKPLVSFVRSGLSRTDKNRREKAAALVATLAGRGEVPGSAIEDIIQLLVDEDRNVRFHAAVALERSTRETQGHAAEKWRTDERAEQDEAYRKWISWWALHRAEYERTRLKT